MAYIGPVAAGSSSKSGSYAHSHDYDHHKTLRGPRGGLIFDQRWRLAKKINSAIFPGIHATVGACHCCQGCRFLKKRWILPLKSMQLTANSQLWLMSSARSDFRVISGGMRTTFSLSTSPKSKMESGKNCWMKSISPSRTLFLWNLVSI